MTVQKARTVFATHMKAARTRKLTTYELNQLSEARQVLRHARKPAMNPSRHPRIMKVGDRVEIKGTGILGVITKQVPPQQTEYPDGSIKVFEVFATRGAHGSFFKSEKQLRLLVSVANKPTRGKSNPGTGKPVLIYGAVNRIYATKTQGHQCDSECARNGHRYFHDFKSKPKMYGLPDGSILIKS